MKNTFVIALDEDTAAFLDWKTHGSGETSESANDYINRLLQQEMNRQGHRSSSDRDTVRKIDELMENTPEAGR